MQASKKAIELVKRFANHSTGQTAESNKNSAKACAEICVDQILSVCSPLDCEFWRSVKTEIDYI